jgi:hypothetical protein
MGELPRDGYSDLSRKHMSDIILAYSTIFHYILNSLSLFSMEIYIITTVTTFFQQRMKLQLHP